MDFRWFSCLKPIAALVSSSFLALTLLLSLCRLAHCQTLQVHYTFENGSGTEVTDVSGHARHGVLTGAQFTTDAKQGRYAVQTFGKQKGHIAITPFDLNNQFSIFMFVKLPDVINNTDSLQPIFANVEGGLTNGIKIYVSRFHTNDRSLGIEVNANQVEDGDDDGDCYKGQKENSTLFSPPGVYPKEGAYHSIAAVINRSTGAAVLYLDGVRVATGRPGTLRTNFNTNTKHLWLGDFPGGGFAQNEILDDFRIYSGLLSDAQVAALHEQTRKPVYALEWGVNVHDGGGDPETMARRLADRNLKSVRMDLWGNDPVYLAKFRRAATLFNARGIKIQAVIFTAFSPGQRRNQDLKADLLEVEQAAYKETRSQVDATKDLLLDYEMGNEITLGTPHILAEGVTGQKATDFDTPSGRLQAAVLRGMSKAIHEVGTASGLPLRIILGTVNRHWGFLAFMQQQGVLFDVVGYHIYPWEKHAPLDQDPWFGTGGPLGQLAVFKKPIAINEFNAGEIYSGTPGQPKQDYLNRPGDLLTETGFKGLDKHLKEILHQTVANVEAIFFYEVVDEARKAPPENRFGLYYDTAMQKPKISLLLATSYAHGTLSQAERKELTDRGIGGVPP